GGYSSWGINRVAGCPYSIDAPARIPPQLLPAAAVVETAGQLHPDAAPGVDGHRADAGGGGGAGSRDVDPGVLADLLPLAISDTHTAQPTWGDVPGRGTTRRPPPLLGRRAPGFLRD